MTFVLVSACAAAGAAVPSPARAQAASPEPAVRAAEPLVRVGIRVGVPAVRLESPAGLLLSDARSGRELARIGPGETVELSRDGAGLALPGTATASAPVFALRVDPEAGGPVVVDGEPYRGRLEVIAVEDSAVSAINVLPLESYLLGVVPLEIGPRGESELAAVQAQAVAARTYAVAHLDGHPEMGFDLFATVEDQVYGGLAVERELASRAVRSTAGRILTFDGLPIRAYYHSTCGGRTAPVEEVLDRPAAPYLRAVDDRAPDGTDWCAISPRHRWTRAWSDAELAGPVPDELARMFGTGAGVVGPVEELRVLERTPSGRVRSLAVRGPRSELVVERLDIRFALRGGEGEILGSTAFEIDEGPDGTTVLHGRGYGHGAGMCQWGAIGRARAGHGYEAILAAYYPAAELTRVY
ncbi:MAG: SpoIID/LytB domain-containing protein [Gemmatimonadota bacterium]|nr:SpoIID/LytB domain-containing protein [Gemmatimonadota bacterium]